MTLPADVEGALDRLNFSLADNSCGCEQPTYTCPDHKALALLRQYCEKVAGLEAEKQSLLRMISCEDNDRECAKDSLEESAKFKSRCLMCQIATLRAQLEQARAGGGHIPNCPCCLTHKPYDSSRADLLPCGLCGRSKSEHPYVGPRCQQAAAQPDPEEKK